MTTINNINGLAKRIVFLATITAVVAIFGGLSLPQAIEASTYTPSKVLGKESEIGSLAVGMSGDAAVFDLEYGSYSFIDGLGNYSSVTGDKMLTSAITIKSGNIVWTK